MGTKKALGERIQGARPERARSTSKLNEPRRLEGWRQISAFLGQPISVAQRWAKSGMPVTHDGRRVHGFVEELNRWLGRESAGEPVKITTSTSDLTAELKRGLSFIRKEAGRTSKRKHV